MSTSARWPRVEEVCHAALECDAGARAAFLATACGDDQWLRQAVDALLAHAEAADQFLAEPIGLLAATALTDEVLSMIGRDIGQYRIIERLGAGGMGEVYKARDTRLGRDVAIKVLPSYVSHDPDHRRRFEREARLLAALNHPHIGTIYGVEEAGGVPALVLELVDGPTLAERIAGGRIPLDEALTIAQQIAQALDAAHERGIIHRDLKPANIMVRPDGTVKVLDFGLAKATDPTAWSSANDMNVPTLTATAVHGVIFGTAAYMSPEQAAGKAADQRSDLWAFGAVLMEMLTGRQVFTGDTVSQVLAAVLAKDPDWTTLPRATPASIRTLLRRCLEKDRGRRIADAADVRLEIDDALTASPDDANVSNSPRSANLWSHLAVGLVVATLVIVGLLAWRGTDKGQTPVYASLDVPAGYVLGEDDFLAPLPTRTPMVFTPDGRSLIIQVARAGKPQLVERSLDRPDARPIAGTEGARVPFVSPDGKWIAFAVDSELKKVPIQGGTPTTICSVSGDLGPAGAAWSTRDVIVFSDHGRIMRVPAGGGVPAPVTPAPSLARLFVAPFFLPDGTHFLFSDVSVFNAADARVMVQAIDGDDARPVVASATDGRLLPSGRLAFMRLGSLMTVGFDLARAQIVGTPIAALGEVMQSGLRARAFANNTGAGMFAVSSLGALAVVRGPVMGGEENHLIWVTRDGRSSAAEPASGAPAGARLYTRISPDRSRAIVTVITPRHFELWLVDWARDLWTSCPGCGDDDDDLSPLIWSPDGRRLLIPRRDALVTHALDGSTPDRMIVREPNYRLQPAAWLADGRIVYTSSSAARTPGFEIKLLNPGDSISRVIVPLGVGREPDVSPDGKWIAYVSTQTGESNVIVQALMGEGSRMPVSTNGVRDPVWSADGRTLYYLKFLSEPPGTAAYAVDSAIVAGRLTVSTPRELFHHPDSQVCTPRCYDVADGPRFLLRDQTTVTRASVTRMDLVLNWTSTLVKER